MGSQLWGYVVSLSPVAKFVLIVLLIFSFFTWAIVLYKTIQFFLLRRDDRNAVRLVEMSLKGGKLQINPQSVPGRSFIPEVLREAVLGSGNLSPEGFEDLVASSLALTRERYESFLVFLAIAGSSSPFIGLFGTVWGVMDAFKGLGKAGGASLSLVSRGIADALVATACGLFVAIPAVIFYNLFQHFIKKWERRAASYVVELFYRLKESEEKAS